MSVSPRVRFEVLKRDRFICAYCGAKAPDVLLHVDHIVPQAAGGGDEIDNLITACVDCNLGKGARMLEEGVTPAVNALIVAQSQQRVEQMRQYRQWHEELERETSIARDMIMQRWCDSFEGKTTRDDAGVHWYCELGFPESRSVKKFLQLLPLQDVLDAIDITANRYYGNYRPRLYDNAVTRYFFGVCQGKKRERDAAAEATRVARVERALRFDLDWSAHGRKGLTPLRVVLDDIVADVA